MIVIAITGGPCAGKTSALDQLRERFEHDGMTALFIPEAATDLINRNVAPWTCASMLDFQTRVIALQLEREAETIDRATAAGIDLIICDRGICDSHAYLSDADYERALAANGIDNAQALARYHAVFHLESIALDNPEAYTKENNSARFETVEEAARVDRRVLRAWSDHPSLHVIENRNCFAEKAEALYAAIVEQRGSMA